MIRSTTTEKHMINIYKRIILKTDRILSLTLSALYISTTLLVVYYLNIGPLENPKSFHFFWSLLADKLSIIDILKPFFMIALTMCVLHGFSIYEFNKSKELHTDKVDNRDIIIKMLSPYTYTLLAVALLPIVTIGVVYSPLLTTPTDSPLLNAMLFISAYFITVRLVMFLTDWWLSEPKRKQEDA